MLADESNKHCCFMVVVKGSADRIDSIFLNDKSVLGGPIRSLQYPLDVTASIKSGLNTLKVVCLNQSDSSDRNKNKLSVVLQRRTSGPKIEMISKIDIPGVHGIKEYKVDFNTVIEPVSITKNEGLSAQEREDIRSMASRYLNAIKSRDSASLKKLYAAGIQAEKRIRPQVAEAFTQSLASELKMLHRKDLKLTCLPLSEVILKKRGETVYALGKEGHELVKSNVIRITPESAITGLVEEGDRSTDLNLRLKKRCLRFRKIKGDWKLVVDASTPFTGY